MYKRPAIRERFQSKPSHKYDVKPGSFLYSIVHPPPTQHYSHIPQPIYRKDDYLRLLAKNRAELGLEPKELFIPDYDAPSHVIHVPECHVRVVNPIHLQLKVLKNGLIRIKLNTAIGELHDKYYTKQKSPSLKVLVQTYKSVGYSNVFLEKIIKSYDKKIKITEAFNMDTAFGKEPVKKSKKKKEEAEEPEEDEDDEEEEDDPVEDGEMDVEHDEDDEIVDQNMEEFIVDDE